MTQVTRTIHQNIDDTYWPFGFEPNVAAICFQSHAPPEVWTTTWLFFGFTPRLPSGVLPALGGS